MTPIAKQNKYMKGGLQLAAVVPEPLTQKINGPKGDSSAVVAFVRLDALTKKAQKNPAAGG